MTFNPTPIIADLDRNKNIVYELLRGIDKETYLWRESADKWSLLEVICHLVDEEKEDFRLRVKSVLENPEIDLHKIDPQGWVNSRKYQEQDYEMKISEWIEERNNSLNWLNTLDSLASWLNAFQHSKFGPLTAKMFLCNWLSHDYHHIRQIITIKRAYIINSTGEKLRYAGKW